VNFFYDDIAHAYYKIQ